jgi:hypothetical protein
VCRELLGAPAGQSAASRPPQTRNIE